MNRKFIKDEMTPRERFSALAKGEKVDRLPCVLSLGDPVAPLIGMPISKIKRSVELMAQNVIVAYKTFHHDGVSVGPETFGIAEAMGTELEYPYNDTVYVKDPILKDYNDFSKLKPINPQSDGNLPKILEALKIVQEEVGNEVGVSSAMAGPFTTAASLRGTEIFLRDLYKNPEEVHRLMLLSTESTIKYIDAVCDMGIVPNILDPVSSNTVISKKQFNTFSKPYLKMCYDHIKKRMGVSTMLHICGDTAKILDDMVETGARSLSLDNVVDLEFAKKAIGNKVALAGNIRPVESLKLGNREIIRENVKECILKGYDNPRGYVISTGCQVPVGTPMENIHYLMEAVREFARLPIKPENLL